MLQADEHLPQDVKDKLRGWAAAASSAWHAHVVEAAWVRVVAADGAA